MKRSTTIFLGAAGAMVVAGAFLDNKADSEPENVHAYASVEECKTDGKLKPEECDREWSSALKNQVASAPKFEAQEDCEKAHGAGQCRSTNWNNHSVFVPALAGFMLARALNGGAAQSQPLYPAGPAVRPCTPDVDPRLRPDCGRGGGTTTTGGYAGSSAARAYTTGSGDVVSKPAGGSTEAGNAVTTRSAARSVGSNQTIIARGGFGATGRGFSAAS